MTLDDLLALLPGLRRCRSLNAAWLRTLLDRQRGQCTWCGEPVGRGRSTWCSDRCVESFRLRCDTAHQMRFVVKRDGGICAVCGRDTVSAKRDGLAAAAEAGPCPPWGRQGTPEHDARDRWHERQEEILARFGWARGQWAEVDHILPVSEGGGLFGPDNLRLLCGRCHQDATAKLRKRLRKGKP